jgi:phosphoribosylaminoimidazole-succinocarboxamide synthase
MPKRWSTKDCEILEAPTVDRLGRARFHFTDDYSVFHYSKMPDRIPDKGAALARMAAFSLQHLDRAGVPTHLIGFTPPAALEVRLARILDPAEMRLSPHHRCRLVPLQVIYRNSVPENASLRRRLALGRVDLDDLGLDALPEPDTVLDRPIIEYTTKLEEIDRFVSRGEAAELAGLSQGQQTRIEEITRTVAREITALAETRGLQCADGKIEFALDAAGEPLLVDTAGTPDENRLLLGGVNVTKQVLRDYYLALGLEHDVQAWAAAGRPRASWPSPSPLPADLLTLVADLYRALCERWTGTRVWDAPPLEEVARQLAARGAPGAPVAG